MTVECVCVYVFLAIMARLCSFRRRRWIIGSYLRPDGSVRRIRTPAMDDEVFEAAMYFYPRCCQIDDGFWLEWDIRTGWAVITGPRVAFAGLVILD